MEQRKNYTVPIIMMMLLFSMISFVTGLASPMALVAKDQFGASDAMSQLGNVANFIAYAFMGIPGGMLLKKVGYKKTALLAIAVGFLGVLIMFLSGVAASFPIYIAGAFVAGFSMCLLNTVVNPMLNTLGGGGKKGNALLQLGGSLNSLAATVTPVLVGYLIGNALRPTIADVNPALFIAMGIFAVVGIVLVMVKIPEPHMQAATAATKEKSKHSPMSFRHFVLGAISIFIYVGVEVGIPAFILLYMTKGLGIGAAIAGSVAGTYWFLMLVGRLTGAAIGAKVSSKAMLTVASALGVALVLISIFTLPNTNAILESPQAVVENVQEVAAVVETNTPIVIENAVDMPVFKSEGGSLGFGTVEVPLGILLLALCGLCTSIMWGSIFNLATEGLGKYVPMASGIFMTLVCGGGILPLIQGAVADSWGYVASYWVVLIGFVFLFYYAIIGSKNVNKDIPVE